MDEPIAVDAVFSNLTSWLTDINAGIHWPGNNGATMTRHVVLSSSNAVAVVPQSDSPGPALAWLRHHDVGSVLAWSAYQDKPTDLNMHAHGFRESFAPSWMWHDLTFRPHAATMPVGVSVDAATPNDRDAYATTRDIPYIDPRISGVLFDRILLAPERTTMMLARSAGAIIGTGALHISHWQGNQIGGIYNVAVASSWRRRGIGTRITTDLLRLAREHNLSGVGLNATGEGHPIYRRAGFVDVGSGQTWSLPALPLDLPTEAVIETAEVIGKGEFERVDPLVAQWPFMPNGESPVRFAARFGQLDAIRWLLDCGAAPDIAPLWSSGFRDEAVQAMRDAAVRDRLWGDPGVTALHDAVAANDPDLLRHLLDAGANRTILDGHWHATPERWAAVLGHDHLAAILGDLPA
ncbi:MAG TPA: GNAT family N-acetyltransferase [Thermomicrobiales bacterium]|nr:GNAT family N-acetyltransferase [Thermomicrobiales bacterium]